MTLSRWYHQNIVWTLGIINVIIINIIIIIIIIIIIKAK